MSAHGSDLYACRNATHDPSCKGGCSESDLQETQGFSAGERTEPSGSLSQLEARPTIRRCAECGKRAQPRGSWSDVFCEPCDITRMHRISTQLNAITGVSGDDKPLDWYVAKSAEISERKGWRHA